MSTSSMTRWTCPRILGPGDDDCRTSWRPIHAGEAFIDGWDPYRTALARAEFYRLAHETATAAANIAAGHRAGTKPQTKPQIAAFYTSCPSRLALEAAIGHTAYVEYSTACGPNPLEKYWSRDLVSLQIQESWTGPPPCFDTVFAFVKQCCAGVHSRLLLQELALHPSLRSIDSYRALMALQVRLPPRSTQELLTAAVLLGDYTLALLDESWGRMGGLLRRQYGAMKPVVLDFERQLQDAPRFTMSKLGVNYVAALLAGVGPFLPRRVLLAGLPKAPPRTLAQAMKMIGRDPAAAPLPSPSAISDGLADSPAEEQMLERELAPLDAPGNSLVAGAASAGETMEKAAEALSSPGSGTAATGSSQPAVPKFLEVLEGILPSANDGRNPSQSRRPDVVERMLLDLPFSSSKLEGEPSAVDWVLMQGWGDGKSPEVRVNWEVAVPPGDTAAWDQLCLTAAPVTRLLNARLFEEKRWRSDWRTRATSGPLDPGRLPLLGLSDCICRRLSISDQDPDRGQRSVVLVAVDVSGSMGRELLDMARLLLCAFGLSLLGRPRHALFAAVYGCRSTAERFDRSACVRWLYHPVLTPAHSPLKGLQAVTLLDESQQGTNLDVPSLAYMTSQAADHAGRGTLFVVQITDCQFNTSMGGKSGKEEMVRFLKIVRSQLPCKYDHTLVAVGESDDYALEGADRLLTLPREGLGDITVVATRVADFVADALKSRPAGRRRKA